MSDRIIDAPSPRLVFHSAVLPTLIVPILAALIVGSLVWAVQGRLFALLICGGIGLFALIDQVQLRLRPPLIVEGGRAIARPRRGGEIRFDATALTAVEVRSLGVFGRGVVVRPGLDTGQGATLETFIGPLRDPTAAWHALDRLRRTGGQ